MTLYSKNSVITKYEFAECADNEALKTFIKSPVPDYYNTKLWTHPEKIEVKSVGWVRGSVKNTGERAFLSVTSK